MARLLRWEKEPRGQGFYWLLLEGRITVARIFGTSAQAKRGDFDASFVDLDFLPSWETVAGLVAAGCKFLGPLQRPGVGRLVQLRRRRP